MAVGHHLVLTDVGEPILVVGCHILWARDSGTYKMENGDSERSTSMLVFIPVSDCGKLPLP